MSLADCRLNFLAIDCVVMNVVVAARLVVDVGEIVVMVMVAVDGSRAAKASTPLDDRSHSAPSHWPCSNPMMFDFQKPENHNHVDKQTFPIVPLDRIVQNVLATCPKYAIPNSNWKVGVDNRALLAPLTKTPVVHHCQ